MKFNNYFRYRVAQDMAIFLKVKECCPFLYHPVLEIYC